MEIKVNPKAYIVLSMIQKSIFLVRILEFFEGISGYFDPSLREIWDKIAIFVLHDSFNLTFAICLCVDILDTFVNFFHTNTEFLSERYAEPPACAQG